jgi:hypothetical protein
MRDFGDSGAPGAVAPNLQRPDVAKKAPRHFVRHKLEAVTRLTAVNNCRRAQVARSTSTPGSGLPSIHSRKAPPAVET